MSVIQWTSIAFHTWVGNRRFDRPTARAAFRMPALLPARVYADGGDKPCG